MRTALLAGLLIAGATLAFAPAASAFGCQPETVELHCYGVIAEEVEITLHWHLGHDAHQDDDLVEACFVNGDPTHGLIGDCRGAVLPDIEL